MRQFLLQLFAEQFLDLVFLAARRRGETGVQSGQDLFDGLENLQSFHRQGLKGLQGDGQILRVVVVVGNVGTRSAAQHGDGLRRRRRRRRSERETRSAILHLKKEREKVVQRSKFVF